MDPQKMLKPALMAELNRLGLGTGGTRPILRARLEAHLGAVHTQQIPAVPAANVAQINVPTGNDGRPAQGPLPPTPAPFIILHKVEITLSWRLIVFTIVLTILIKFILM